MPARDPAAAPHIPPPLSATPPGPGLPTHFPTGRARSGSSAAAAGMYREFSTSPSASNRRTSATLGIALPNPNESSARRVSQGGEGRMARLFRRLSTTSDHSDHPVPHAIDPVSGVVDDAICESAFEREEESFDECVSCLPHQAPLISRAAVSARSCHDWAGRTEIRTPTPISGAGAGS